jgi:putative ABC transport system permease protein
MGRWSRLLRTLRSDRAADEIEEELVSHLEEAVAGGRDPDEARRALGGPARSREASRDIRMLPWLDALRADVRFGWRQLLKNRVTSSAAVLSLGLAMGACVGAFRLVDAVLLRPLPIAHPDRLFDLVRVGADAHGTPTEDDSCEYPLFLRMRDRVRDQADLIAISHASPADVSFAGEQETEKAYRQYVSGTMFGVFGLRPALGRLLTADDDVTPGASPNGVLSYDYWTRRFGRDTSVIGRTFHINIATYQIVGVAPAGFTGTEPGVPVDIFIPTIMNPQVTRADASWFRTFVSLRAGVRMGAVIEPLRATFQSTQVERAKTFVGLPPEYMRAFLGQTLVAQAAGAGVSFFQRSYTRALAALVGFVALVLLIACANISNLRLAQAAARSREMALRVSIGAGRGRLIQLMLVESALLAAAGAAVGTGVAWASAPLVVSQLNGPSNAIALALPIDWRVASFGVALTCAVALLFGLLPALRVSGTSALGALKGGLTAGSRRQTLDAPIAAQVAFCALVLLISGLFVSTFDRLSEEPIGFSPERLVTLDTIAQPSQPPAIWNDLVATLNAIPGVEAAAASQFALLSGEGSNGFIWINGAPTTNTLAYFLGVSPDWRRVMNIPLANGRDLRDTDQASGAAIVNEAFAKEYLPGRNPVGQWFERELGTSARPRYEIVGVVRNARYRNIREAMTPTAYVPLSVVGAGAQRPLAQATLVVRTSGADPTALVPVLRRAVRARAGFRVNDVRTQQDIDDAQIVRERLLAALAWFFAIVALALTAIGIYGVMFYTVQQSQHDIGIYRAIGAQAADIVSRVGRRVVIVLAAGTVTGLGVGLLVVRYLATLFYGVRATDIRQLAEPSLAIVVVGALAALPPVLRALRVSPTIVLRGE